MISIKTVNSAIKKLGGKAELVKGVGYFYFWSDDVSFVDGSSVFVYRINDLSLADWIEEYKSLKVSAD